jgi:hypothetical protein
MVAALGVTTVITAACGASDSVQVEADLIDAASGTKGDYREPVVH